MQQFTTESISRRGAEGTVRRVARDVAVFHDVTGQFCCQRGSFPHRSFLHPFGVPWLEDGFREVQQVNYMLGGADLRPWS